MLGTLLIQIRKDLGFKTAKAFFDGYLSRKNPVGFNYTYYMKIEGAKVLPSPSVLQEICGTLPDELSDAVALEYCKMILPQKKKLFERPERAYQKTNSDPAPASESPTLIKQKYLNPLQIQTIAKSQAHYFAFLILTLARWPIPVEQFKKSFAEGSILADFQTAYLVTVEKGMISALTKEAKFPEGNDSSKKLYAQIDAWNLKFGSEQNFNPQLQKMILRRVSPRYLKVIVNQFNNILDIIRASDEIDQYYNSEVILVNLNLSHGVLTG